MYNCTYKTGSKRETKNKNCWNEKITTTNNNSPLNQFISLVVHPKVGNQGGFKLG